MQLFTDVKQKAAEFASENASTLLTAGGVVGVVGTAVLAGRAGFKLAKVETEKQWSVYEEKYDHETNAEGVKPEDVVVSKKDMILGAAPELIPTVVSGGITIGAIIYANRISAQKAAALAAAYGLLEGQFGDYKSKVLEKVTGPKAKSIEDEVASDRLKRTEDQQSQVIILEGNVLCFDAYTGRYFDSNMETLRRAVNATMQQIFAHGFATASFFYDEIDLPGTSWSDHLGWNLDCSFDVKYTSDIAKNGKPCIVINFSQPPTEDYVPKNY